MTDYVCSQLSSPDVNGLQNCMGWVESPSLIPAITQSQANEISGAILGVLAAAFCFRLLMGQIKKG